jgi:hypothetical protein
MSWVIDNSNHSLGSFIVLLMIANHAKADGTGAWPSVETLAKESRMSARNVQRCLRHLVETGELAIKEKAGPSGTHIYRLPKMTGAKLSPLSGVTNRAGGVTNRAKKMSELSPEPSLTVLKSNRQVPRRTPARPLTTTISPEEHRRRIEARQQREQKEQEVSRELRIGAGPRLAESIQAIGKLKAL